MTDDVRRAVAARYGLTEDASGFLTGTTLAELEASANSLAGLIAARDARADPEPTAPVSIIAEALAHKQARKKAIVAMFSGRPTPQPRDAQGRFTAGFDGGARASLPVPRDPERDHSALVSQLAALRRVFDAGS